MAEGEVPARLAPDVEHIGIGKTPLVTVGCAHQTEQGAACRHGLLLELGVAYDEAGNARTRGLVPEQLVDGIGCQRGMIDQHATLVGIVGQHLPHPPDEPHRRLVAGRADDVDVGQDFFTAEPADGAGLVLEFDVEQRGHDVVGGVLGAPVHVGGEQITGQA